MRARLLPTIALVATLGAYAVPGAAAPQTTQPPPGGLLEQIEGQPTPTARREFVRQFLRDHGAKGVQMLLPALSANGRPAQLYAAAALTDFPELLDDSCLAPLLAMLSDPDAELRGAAAAALGAFPRERSLPALRGVLLDAQTPRRARLAALDALERLGTRSAAAAAVAALDDSSAGVAAQALASLEQHANRSFTDASEARAWWQDAQRLTESQWQALQIARLGRRSMQFERRARELEARLVGALREVYLRTAEAERQQLLNTHLSDSLASVRLLGLDFTQGELSQGRTIAPSTASLIRELLRAAEPAVRAAAVQTVAAMRDPADESLLLDLLRREPTADVRAAIVSGLGFLGGSASVDTLLECVNGSDSALVDAAVTSLGRLAERSVLDADATRRVSDALAAAEQAPARPGASTRERLLWAMGRLADPRFAPRFIEELAGSEPTTVRIAALRGIAVLIERPASGPSPSQPTAARPRPQLDEPQRAALVNAIVPLVADPEPTIRKAAVEALSQNAETPEQLEALWQAFARPGPNEEALRETAWRGVVRLLASRSVAEIESWLARLPDDAETRNQRRLELLLLAEKHAAAEAIDRARLGRIRAQIAEMRAELAQPQAALDAYVAAADDLAAADQPDALQVCVDLVLFALRSGGYDAALVRRLSERELPFDADAFWPVLFAALSRELEPRSAEQVLGWLDRLAVEPPLVISPPMQERLGQVRAAALRARAEQDREGVQLAIRRLAENPEDAEAAAQILALGKRAAPTVRDALAELLARSDPDPQQEARLIGLLKQLVPTWPAYQSSDALEQKLEALKRLEA
ncbi:MAG: HEAT repeat domain-containing protein [Phycisphaerae bacterium]|jgi:HEAT repeat protein